MFLDFIDIDECSLGTDHCEQICTNNVGSYTCSCKSGFELSSDGLHCSGKEFKFKNHTHLT